MNSLEKILNLPAAVKKAIEESGEELRIGDMFFAKSSHDDARIIRVTQIKEFKQGKTKDHYVYYDEATNWKCTKWASSASEELSAFLNDIKERNWIRVDRPLNEIFEEANKVISGEISLDEYRDTESDVVNNENALIGRSSKDALLSLQKAMEQKKDRAGLIKAAVKFEIAKRKAELEKIKDGLNEIMKEFEKKIVKIVRVITTIELYLGVDEELHQIRDGEPAPSSTPISFRQALLYMDEEVGDWSGGGLDYSNIDWFDNWLNNEENLNQVLPEKKGVVVFRPRRKAKDYRTDNVYYEASENAKNLHRTYFLIRNGDCLYRIFTEKLTINDRLFPKRDELQRLMDEINSEETEKWHKEEEKQENLEKAIYHYRKRAFLLQGLIHRTEVFHPLPAEEIDIFKLDTLGDKVQFIYDDEMLLPTGRKSFRDWRKEINEKIAEGSRILITGEFSWKKEYAERFYLAKNSYEGEVKDVPDLPQLGVYTVEEFFSSYKRDFRETDYKEELKKLEKQSKIKYKALGVISGWSWKVAGADKKTGSRDVYRILYYEEDGNLTIMYMPSKEARSGWDDWRGHERKNRTRFKIFRDDPFVINYDQISLDDIEFYITSRVDRPNYLDMMPVLVNIKKHLLEEEESENDFKKLAIGECMKQLKYKDQTMIELEVEESILWWKFKNKWKRAILKDDALALKMIVNRVCK